MIRLFVPIVALTFLAPSFLGESKDKGFAQASGPASKASSLPSPSAESTGGGVGAGFGELKEGGPVSPSGHEICCDLPVSLRMKNVGGRDGAGLCVFTSIMHNARFQNEQRLWNFQADMRKEPGGGYPQKVDAMIAKYGNGAPYVQHTGGDKEFLWNAMKTGRPVGITYDGRDMHYGARQRIAHMVSLVHIDPPETSPRWYGILDNNFIGPDQLVWLTEEDFLSRWKGNSGGWGVVLLAPAAMPVPHN